MAGSRDRNRKKIQGKGLFGRVEPVQRNRGKKLNSKEGFTVVNGRLVSANDVGALLRQASSTVEARKSSKGQRKEVKTTQRRFTMKRLGNTSLSSNKQRAKRGAYQNNRLVISTNDDSSNKVLLFNNLELGVNHETLKNVLEDLSNASIARVRVTDLPSGSAMANVWLSRPNAEELERVRKFFDGALVDGRTIKVSTTSEFGSKLAY